MNRQRMLMIRRDPHDDVYSFDDSQKVDDSRNIDAMWNIEATDAKTSLFDRNEKVEDE